ncbi:hypothetical protein SeKA_B0037 (plasmid) [Salmonella enterica subsp. enterica serovar Kentucky str. CVM29188]|nr:hypothetical protein SeKA_B0037 [Salmonella enterica subsp. enterica serovar Kentucky str. CVM29188]
MLIFEVRLAGTDVYVYGAVNQLCDTLRAAIYLFAVRLAAVLRTDS